MSKKTIRTNVVKWLLVAASTAALIASCATKGDGDGSESHFLCTADSDCVSRGDGYRCVDRTCTKATSLEAGATGGSGNATSSSGGESGASGGGGNGPGAGGSTGGSGNATSGGAAGSETVVCPDPFYYPPDAGGGAFPPSLSPIGFVDGGIYGCHPPRELAQTGWFPNGNAPECPGAHERCTYAPTALPCGACTADEFCAMSVAAICDWGAGPFVDVYWDAWGCKCVSGQWDCRVIAPSGSSCFKGGRECLAETRSPPYSPGMVIISSTGVRVALTSTPAPPSLGDNTWTFTVKDAGGALVPGATITASQKMVDHGHSGSKLIVVTDLGGGNYRAEPVNFNMSGYWETTLHIQKAPLDDHVVIKLCVQ